MLFPENCYGIYKTGFGAKVFAYEYGIQGGYGSGAAGWQVHHVKAPCQNQNRTYVTMDDTQLRSFAQADPKLFMQTYPPPIRIDEVQKAP